MKSLITLTGLLLLLIATLAPAPARAAEERTRFMTLSVGSFNPGGDYDTICGKPFNTGGDFALSVTFLPTKLFGFEVGLHGMSAEAGDAGLGSEVRSFGFETLMVIQQERRSKFQPYAAAGLGLYSNRYTLTTAGVGKEEGGSGLGLVGKVGIRYFMGDNLFIGMSFKYNTNKQDALTSSGTKKLDMGGSATSFDIGVSF